MIEFTMLAIVIIILFFIQWRINELTIKEVEKLVEVQELHFEQTKQLVARVEKLEGK
jgi:hypothetical protein